MQIGHKSWSEELSVFGIFVMNTAYLEHYDNINIRWGSPSTRAKFSESSVPGEIDPPQRCKLPARCLLIPLFCSKYRRSVPQS